MTYCIRPATAADTDALGRVHSAAWRESYADILPESILATSGSIETRTAKRRAIFTSTTSQHSHFLVETDDGRIVGFGDCGPAREVGDYAPAEITTLYLLREAQGKGLGRKLLFTMLKHLADREFPSAALKVFAANEKSRGFYEGCGGQRAGRIEVTMGGLSFPTAVYLWPDLKGFAASLPP